MVCDALFSAPSTATAAAAALGDAEFPDTLNAAGTSTSPLSSCFFFSHDMILLPAKRRSVDARFSRIAKAQVVAIIIEALPTELLFLLVVTKAPTFLLQFFSRRLWICFMMILASLEQVIPVVRWLNANSTTVLYSYYRDLSFWQKGDRKLHSVIIIISIQAVDYLLQITDNTCTPEFEFAVVVYKIYLHRIITHPSTSISRYYYNALLE
jgi:hypothetical protein